MQVQLGKAQPTPGGAEFDADCLCPPVCFQCPPPFCLPCGPGPGGASPDLSGECVPAPKQCGPFILLNTPMDRRCVMLPTIQPERPAERQGRRGHGGHEGRAHRDAGADCCDQPHHHHHDDECCDEPHHHHHHRGDDEYEKCDRHENRNRRERDDDGGEEERDASRSRRLRNVANADHNVKSRPKRMNEPEPRGRDRKRSHAKTPRTQSRELRSGKLYIGCDCDRRNGLQDDCQRSLCQGRPECITIPPTCAPSAFSNGKHLQMKRDEAERKIRERFKYCD